MGIIYNSASRLQQHLQTRAPALADGEGGVNVRNRVEGKNARNWFCGNTGLRRFEEQQKDPQLDKDGNIQHGTRVCGELHHSAGIVIGKYQGASISHCQPGWEFAFFWWCHPDSDSYKQTGKRGCNKETRDLGSTAKLLQDPK